MSHTTRACRLPISERQHKQKIQNWKEYRLIRYLALVALVLNSLMLLVVLGIGLYNVRYLMASALWLSVFLLTQQRLNQVNSMSLRQIFLQELKENRNEQGAVHR
jgi:hypothetical protein